MISQLSFATLIVLWMATAAIIALVRWKDRAGSAGLVFAYLLNFWLIHWLASACYLFPWAHFKDPATVKRGLEESTYGILGFALGSLLLAPQILASIRRPANAAPVHSARSDPRLLYVAIGIVATGLMFAGLGTIPTLSAFLSTGQSFLVAGICLSCGYSWHRKRWAEVLLWVAFSLLLPLFTVAAQGFLGFGALACFTVICFLTTLVRRRLPLTIGLTVAGYLWLSLFVTYMRDRDELRKSVWGGQTYDRRMNHIKRIFTTMEWFDPYKAKHLERIDGRLNQNYLVGRAVTQLEHQGGYMHGETIWQAAIALVPRIIWPDKPVGAGSGDLVSRLTGMYFPPGTSVGIGHVMEFYANFGDIGVIVGYILLGTAITVIDSMAGWHLRMGDVESFSIWFLCGLGMIIVGGSFVELTATAGTGMIAAYLLRQFSSSSSSQSKDRPGRESPRRVSPVRLKTHARVTR
jgi:hypothetical protein